MTFWTIALNDLRLSFKDRMFFFWLLVFPMLFAVVFGLAFSGSTPGDTKVTLNVLDNDDSYLSRALIKELRGEKYLVGILEAESEMKTRTLIIPEDFQKKVLAGEQVELVLKKEPESNIQASQAAYSNALKAVIQILTNLVSTAPEDENQLEERYESLHLERRITLRAEMAGELREIPAGFNHTIPAVAVMFVLFTVFMYGGILILEERNEGQLERIYLSPATFSSIVGGKWLARLLLGMLQVSLLFIIGKILFNTYWGTSFVGLFLVALFYCGTIAGISILLGSVMRKLEVLIVLNILLANLMAALGGCWFPREFFPESLKKASLIFPTSWTMDALGKLIFFGKDLGSISTNIFVLIGFTLVFLVLAVRFFKLRKV